MAETAEATGRTSEGNVWRIYLLRDPDDATIGYVGQTRRDPAKRLREHMRQASNSCAKRTSLAKGEWFRSCTARGVRPILEVLEKCRSAADANVAEKKWIRYVSSELHLRLVNSTEGGQGVYPFDYGERISRALQRPESREKKSRASKAIARSTWDNPEIRARRLEGVKRNWADPERQGAAKAAWLDPAKRAARLVAHRAATSSPEYRKKLSESMKRSWVTRNG